MADPADQYRQSPETGQMQHQRHRQQQEPAQGRRREFNELQGRTPQTFVQRPVDAHAEACGELRKTPAHATGNPASALRRLSTVPMSR